MPGMIIKHIGGRIGDRMYKTKPPKAPGIAPHCRGLFFVLGLLPLGRYPFPLALVLLPPVDCLGRYPWGLMRVLGPGDVVHNIVQVIIGTVRDIVQGSP